MAPCPFRMAGQMATLQRGYIHGPLPSFLLSLSPVLYLTRWQVLTKPLQCLWTHIHIPLSHSHLLFEENHSRCFSRGYHCGGLFRHPRGEIYLTLGHMAFSPYPYSVTGLALGNTGDSYLRSSVMVLSGRFRLTLRSFQISLRSSY